MNPDLTSFEDCDFTNLFKIIDKQTQTGPVFTDSEDSTKSDKSQNANKSHKLPLPRDFEDDDCIKVFSFCQILQDPSCPRSVTLIKDSVTEEVRKHPKSSKDDGVANRYRYCREVIKPFLKDYPPDCPESDEQLIQDAISSASEDFPDYQPCFDFFPANKDTSYQTPCSDEDRTPLGLPDKRCLEIPVFSAPKPKQSREKANPKTSDKHCNTEEITKKSCAKNKVDKSTHCTPKSSRSSSTKMDDPRGKCSSKGSISKKSCPECSTPIKICQSKDCPSKGKSPKSCPLNDAPEEPCQLKDCPADVCPPKTCKPEPCPSEFCPDATCPPKECPLEDTPRKCAPPKCPKLECPKKSKPDSRGNSKCHIDESRKSKDEGKNANVVHAEKPKCKSRDSETSLDIKSMVQAHNETITTLKNAMDDFLCKVYKSTQDAVSTIANESTKQIEKFRKSGSISSERNENKGAETMTGFNFARKVEGKGNNGSGTCSDDDTSNVVNKFVRKVESTMSIVSGTVVDNIPDKFKGSYNDAGSPYDDPDKPRRVSHELIHEPTVVIQNNVFTTIKAKLCSIFCETQDKNKPESSKKGSCSSKSSSKSSVKDEDEKIIERFIE